MALLDGGIPSLQEIMAQQRRQAVFSGMTQAGLSMLGGAPIGQALGSGLAQMTPDPMDALNTYAAYQGIQDSELERTQAAEQRAAQEAYLNGPTQFAGEGLGGSSGGMFSSGISSQERALAEAMGPDAYFAGKAKQHFAAPKDPLIKTFDVGDEKITRRYNRATGEWEDMEKAPRYKPTTTINVGGELPKPPSGYFYTGVDPKDPQLAPIPGWSGPDAVKRKAALNTVGRMQDGLDRYRKILGKHGAEVMPGPDKMELKAAYTNLLMEGKELFNLGVLNGPDLEIMQQYMQDPTTLRAKGYEAVGGLEGFARQLDQVQEKLDAARIRAEGLYGPGKSDKVPAGSTRFRYDPTTDELVPK